MKSSTTRSTSLVREAGAAPPRRRAPGSRGSRRARAGTRAASGRSPRRRRGGSSRLRAWRRACRAAAFARAPTIASIWLRARRASAGGGRGEARSSARSTPACTEARGSSSGSRCSSRVQRRAAGAAAAPRAAADVRRRVGAAARRADLATHPTAAGQPGGERAAAGSTSNSAPTACARSGRVHRGDPRAAAACASRTWSRGSRAAPRTHRRDRAPGQRGLGPGRERQRVGHRRAHRAGAQLRVHRGRRGHGGATDRGSAHTLAVRLDRRRRLRRPRRGALRSPARVPGPHRGRGRARRDRRRRAGRGFSSAGDSPAHRPGSSSRSRPCASSRRPGAGPRDAGVLSQLVDLAFPLSFYEQAPFVARGVPALTLTTGDRPRDAGLRATRPRSFERRHRTARPRRAAAPGVPRRRASSRAGAPRPASTSAADGRARLGDPARALPRCCRSSPPSSTSSRAAGDGGSRSRPPLRSYRTQARVLARPSVRPSPLRRARRLAGRRSAPARARERAVTEWPLAALAGLAVVAGSPGSSRASGLLPRAAGRRTRGARRVHGRAPRTRRALARGRGAQRVRAPPPAPVAPRLAVAAAACGRSALGAGRSPGRRVRGAGPPARVVRDALRPRARRAVVPAHARRDRLRGARLGRRRAGVGSGRGAAHRRWRCTATRPPRPAPSGRRRRTVAAAPSGARSPAGGGAGPRGRPARRETTSPRKADLTRARGTAPARRPRAALSARHETSTSAVAARTIMCDS